MSTIEFESRLERLEGQVRRYRLVSILMGLGVIGLAGIAATAPATTSDEIRAHKIVIFTSAGKEAAHLQAGPHGGVLDILNEGGFPVVRIGASAKGGTVALAEPKGQQQFVEITTAEDGGEVLIADKTGQKTLMKATPTRQK